MQYLVTDHEETRQQVLAAMSEAEGLGEVRTVASPEKLRELLEPEVTSCILVDEALEGRIALPIIQELSRTYPLIPAVLLSRARTPARAGGGRSRAIDERRHWHQRVESGWPNGSGRSFR